MGITRKQMAAKIFFCGEVVADLVEFQQGSADFKLLLGGSQFHGAMGASRTREQHSLATDIAFVAPVSADDFGDRFLARLEAARVDTSMVKRVARNTTLAVVSVRPGKENSFTFYGRDTAEQMTQPDELPTVLLGGDNKICVFGSISTVLEPARFTWLEFAKRQKQHALVYYDLNTRPAIAKDQKRYQGIVTEWAGIADVVKASEADISWAYPGQSPQQVAAQWFAAGATLAVFTLGDKGSIALTPQLSAKVDSQAVKVKNTIGAGDNFNAGFVCGLVKTGIIQRSQLQKINVNQIEACLLFANNTAKQHLATQAA
jgi:fructokinase